MLTTTRVQCQTRTTQDWDSHVKHAASPAAALASGTA